MKRKFTTRLLAVLVLICAAVGLAACDETCAHTYSDWVESKAATCTESGEKTRACDKCGNTETQTIDALGHEYAETGTTDESGHWHVCTRDNCDKKTTDDGIDKNNDHECDICGVTVSEHTGGTATCTEKAVCVICNNAYGEFDPNNHTGGTATCTEKAVCVSCNTPYGELDPDNHTFVDDICACGAIDATEMTAEQVNAAMAEVLASGKTSITVILAPDADANIDSFYATSTMQYAIRSALSNSAVADDSIDLTIKGLKNISDGFLGEYNYRDESTGYYVEEAAVTKVRSITLTDATKIGMCAFMNCTSLVSVSAPNVSNIEDGAFEGCTSLDILSLTAEEEITIADTAFGSPSVSEQVKLILHANKQANAVKNIFAGYTFGAVTYTCADGTTTHSAGETVAYIWSEDYTVCSAGYTCTKCGYVDVTETVTSTIGAVTENSTAHSADFTNAAFETQTKTFGYVYDSGTNTYSVWDEAGLNIWYLAVSKNSATNLTLMADITLSTEGITVDENGKPSGSNWTYVDWFEGTLDGGGHSIVNLRIYEKTHAQFINLVLGGTVKNLTFVNPVIYGESSYTATLASKIHDGSSIINCHVQGGSVTGKNGTGGLIGTMSAVKTNYVYGCTNSAKVTGTEWVGGIIGTSNYKGNVIAVCANTGEISGNNNVGGIVGDPQDSDKLIACYTTVGNLCGNTDATVTGSYDADVNTADVVNAMNMAIDTWNGTDGNTQITYKWAVGTDGFPVLVKAE